jgi:tetratricopeptide (TPR) repeat protein
MIKEITVNGNNLIVTRVVITLSEKAEWAYQADTANHLVNVAIPHCEASNPPTRGLDTSTLVSQITTRQNKRDCVVSIDLSSAFYIETMALENPYRIVIDLFKAKRSYSLQETLAQAEFYENAGKLLLAGKEYARATRKFPENKDTCFFWGRLMLRQQNYEKAKDKFRQVPEQSAHYKEAQRFLAMLINNDYNSAALAVKPIEEKPIVTNADTVANKTVAPAPVFNEQCGDNWTPCSIVQKRVLWMPLWGWLICLLILAIALLLIIDLKRMIKDRKDKSSSVEVSFLQNEALKLKMVKKLMDSGWNAQAIARELMITEKEVHALAKQNEINSPDEED